jgi:WXG100 family type VII secretion target
MANINVSYHDLQDAAGKLQGFEAQIQDELKQAQALIQNLIHAGFVTDLASKAFDEAYSKFTQSAQGLIGSMNDMGKYLTNAASTMQETDQKLAQGIGG